MLTSLPDLTTLKILVVDDRPSVCAIVVRMLAGQGIVRVESVCSGAEGLRAIDQAEQPFDVAIFDIDMPADDGLVCLRKLATVRSRPAVILMSGKDPVVLESARQLGESLGVTILETLAKPLSSRGLKGALETFARPGAIVRQQPVQALRPAEIACAIDEGRFELWFQPQLHIASGRIQSAEALLRLRHQQRGVIGPDAFIKPAEDHGLIGRLTTLALEAAVQWAAKWQRAGSPLTISLNLSKAGLDDLSLPDRAAEVCGHYHLPTSRLGFELTESSLAANATAVLDILSRLRLKGFRLSLDDFGTGYASLEELRSLPFHELKLDRQFVQSAELNPRSRAILENSVRLAAELRLTMVAEGVETEAMLRLVSDLGCQVAQGYLIGGPTPGDAVLESVTSCSRNGNGPNTTDVTVPKAIQPVIGDSVLRFAHDAASPLMLVLGLSETLLEDSSLSAEQRSDVSQIHCAAQEVTARLKALQLQVLGAEGRGLSPTRKD